MRPYTGLLNSIVLHGRYYAKRPVMALEIGVHKGVSTDAILRAITQRKLGGMLYSIDIRESFYSPLPYLKQYWTFINSNSKDVTWDKEIDILLIDGNHSYKYVKNDFEHFEPFVRKGGMILLHDMTNFKYDGYKYWTEIKYPKILLNLGRNGMGIVTKV